MTQAVGSALMRRTLPKGDAGVIFRPVCDDLPMAHRDAVGPAALLLTATVARRYYLDGATKSEIAAELDLSRFKVARLLEQARASGLVRIEFDHGGDFDLDLSLRLQAAHGLRHCIVVDGPDGDDELLRGALGRAAAQLLTEIVGADDVLGLAWARSLLSMRSSLAAARRRARWCSSRARCTGRTSTRARSSSCATSPPSPAGPSFCFYAPMIVPDAATARVMRTQPEIARALECRARSPRRWSGSARGSRASPRSPTR